jgi:hypothetical protein
MGTLWQSVDKIKLNLQKLATIQRGEKLGFSSDGSVLERRRNLTGLVRALKSESILDNAMYLDPLKMLFSKALEQSRLHPPRVSMEEIRAGHRGLKILEKTYGDQYSGDSHGDRDRRDKLSQIVRETATILGPGADLVHYTMLQGDMPGADEFRELAFGNDPFGRAADHVLVRINDLLESYEANRLTRPPENRTYTRLYLRADLYMTTTYWLENRFESEAPDAYHAVRELNGLVHAKLCRNYGVGAAKLPMELRRRFGKEIESGPGASDRKYPTYYLDIAQREKYRIVFNNGVAYQYPWWLPDLDPDVVNFAHSLVPAESSHAIEQQFIEAHEWVKKNDPRSLHLVPLKPVGNFVIGMNREMYIGKHQSRDSMFTGENVQKGFFHSSYLSGDTVLCAGGIYIEKGRIRAVSNSSGHYQPDARYMLNTIECLLMHGVNMSNVYIHVWRPERVGGAVSYMALPYLRKRGRMITGDQVKDPYFG